MPVIPADVVVSACKRPLEVALEIAEVVVEAAEKAREIQLAAAVDAHAALEATRKSLDGAGSLAQLADVQLRLMTGNFAKSVGYWASLAGNAREAQMRIASVFARRVN
jgi:hypothetical protein